MRFLLREKFVDGKRARRRVAASLATVLLFVGSPGSVPAQEPADAESEVALRGVVIPTGFQARKYLAMIQVAVDGSPLPDATWDLGVSFLPDEGTKKSYSGHVRAGEPGRPVVFETLIEFEPGHYALELDARETSAGQNQTRTLDDRWPDPSTSQATISPIVLLQPVQGSFLRDDSVRAQGALALGSDEPAKNGLPTALVSVVCRGAKAHGSMRVERKLEGASSVEFETIELLAGNEPCAQVRDILRPGTLGSGYFRYHMRVLGDDGEIATKAHEFTAGNGAQERLQGS